MPAYLVIHISIELKLFGVQHTQSLKLLHCKLSGNAFDEHVSMKTKAFRSDQQTKPIKYNNNKCINKMENNRAFKASRRI